MASTPLPRVAYFCMEYALQSDFKMYAGGLGYPGGDYWKEQMTTAFRSWALHKMEARVYRPTCFSDGKWLTPTLSTITPF